VAQDNARPPASGLAQEEAVWTGRSSQVKNFWAFVLCVLVIPIPWAIWRYLLVRSGVFRLTTERLLITKGVLTKVTESLELYRIRDLRVVQSFWQRLFGLQDIQLITTDSSTPQITLDYIPASQELPDQFRGYIEACRVAKRVREIDVE
jgi:uncharacterized membrane protein YdbT with pleckstrin-like domain